MRRVSFFLRTFLRAVKTSSSRRRWGLPGCRVGFDLSLFLRGHLRVGSVGVWEFICDIAFRAMLVASSKNNQKKHVWHGYLIDQCVWPVRLAVRLASAFGQCVWRIGHPVLFFLRPVVAKHVLQLKTSYHEHACLYFLRSVQPCELQTSRTPIRARFSADSKRCWCVRARVGFHVEHVAARGSGRGGRAVLLHVLLLLDRAAKEHACHSSAYADNAVVPQDAQLV